MVTFCPWSKVLRNERRFSWALASVVNPMMSLYFSLSSDFKQVMLSFSFDMVRWQDSHSAITLTVSP